MQADDLIQLASQGDADALERLLRRYRSWMLGIARAEIGESLRRYVDDDDIVQHASAQAFRYLTTLDITEDPAKQFEAWLSQVLRNSVRYFARKHRRRMERLATSVIEVHPERGPTASAVARAAERRSRLEHAIAGLPEEYRVVIELQLKGLKQQQIADRLGTTKAAVNSRQERARRQLRELLGSTSLNLPSA